jgi:N-acyl-D-aspartate/D-glutamate deacylase
MLTDDNTLIGLGDGGAHYSFVCDAGYPTSVLAYWARDRNGDDRLSLPDAIHFLSRRNALAMGLTDRGLIEVGMKADINVIDFDNLRIAPFEVCYDLPAGGRRVLQHAQGYEATLVSGIITHRNDRPTGATPGRLVKLTA